MRTNIDKIRTIEVTGTYFNDRVVMVYPENTYIKDCDMRALCFNILNAVTDEYDDFPLNTKNHMRDIRDIFKEHILSVCDQSMTHPSAEEKVTNILLYSFPDDEEYRNAPDVIVNEKASMHITRVLLQTVLDQLHVGKRTHMSVVNPLSIDSHKWDEVTSKNNGTQQIKHHVDSGKGLVFGGEYTTVPVILPAPDNNLVSHDEASKAATGIFRRVTSEFNMNKSPTTQKRGRVNSASFEPIKTKKFIQDLHAIVTEELLKECNPSDNNKKRIVQTINKLFPSHTEHEKYPDAVYCQNAGVHITRMVIQSLFDLIGTYETHMFVDDPFNITEHKWNEITIS